MIAVFLKEYINEYMSKVSKPNRIGSVLSTLDEITEPNMTICKKAMMLIAKKISNYNEE